MTCYHGGSCVENLMTSTIIRGSVVVVTLVESTGGGRLRNIPSKSILLSFGERKNSSTIDFCRLSPQKTVVAQVCRGKTSPCFRFTVLIFLLSILFNASSRFLRKTSIYPVTINQDRRIRISYAQNRFKNGFQAENIDSSSNDHSRSENQISCANKNGTKSDFWWENIDISLRILALRGEESPGISR